MAPIQNGTPGFQVTDVPPFYGYNKLDPNQKKYSVTVQDTVVAPIDEAFDLARDWTSESKFWRTTFDGPITVDSFGQKDNVGDIRHFTQNSRTYSEILLHVDRSNHRFVYGLVHASVPALLGVVTTVDFDPVPDVEGTIKVSWSSIFQPIQPIPPLVALIKQTQTVAYRELIAELKKIFNPHLGRVTVEFVSGSVQKCSPNYIGLRVSGQDIEWIECSRNGTPRYTSPIHFSVFNHDDQIQIGYYHRALFKLVQTELGSGYIQLDEVKPTDASTQIEIKDDENNSIGHCTVNLKVEWDEKPPIDQATEIGSVALLVLKDLQTKVVEIAAQLIPGPDGEVKKWEYGSYGDDFGPLPKFCKVLPPEAAIMPHRAGQLFQRVTEYLYSEIPLLNTTKLLSIAMTNPDQLPDSAKESLKELVMDPFLSPYRGWMPKPELMIKNLKDKELCDLEIAAQLIRGVNPMKITIATSSDQIPRELQCLADDRGRSVDEIIEQKELFFCDFWEVAQGDVDEEQGFYYNQAMALGGFGKLGPLKYWYAPQLACYKNADGKLDILGFILTRFTDKPNVVYNAKSTPPNLYTLAKLHLTCADNQHHQFISHLGFAHLAMEPLAVANHNVFPPGKDRHPIGTLLHPHFHDTIGINFLARQTLVSEIAPFTDATFSPGTANAMKIFSAGYQNWDFLDDNFVNNLKKRGFNEVRSDDLDGYYYRDDGFKVWNAFKKHFGNIVCSLYNSDDELANDERIQAWCDEVRNPDLGDLKTFPSSITTRELLTEVITSIVFYCSAQHAAVNFS